MADRMNISPDPPLPLCEEVFENPRLGQLNILMEPPPAHTHLRRVLPEGQIFAREDNHCWSGPPPSSQVGSKGIAARQSGMASVWNAVETIVRRSRAQHGLREH